MDVFKSQAVYKSNRRIRGLYECLNDKTDRNRCVNRLKGKDGLPSKLCRDLCNYRLTVEPPVATVHYLACQSSKKRESSNNNLLFESLHLV